MLRRAFLMGISVVPLGAAALAGSESQAGIVLSSRKGEPGYVEWCKLNGDRLMAKIYLDGIEQTRCTAVDQPRGIVRRAVLTEKGNIAHDGEKILEEEVFGDVRVEIVPRRT